MFKLGDEVIVVDNGHFYSTYSKMEELMELTKFVRWAKPVQYALGNIIAKSFHSEAHNEVVYGVRLSSGEEYIFPPEGLEKAPPQYITQNGYRYKLEGKDEINS